MNLIRYPILGSTNDLLAEMADGGAPEWTVVVADRQTAGKGRGGREWWSPGGNLYMSVLLRPVNAPRELSRLPLIASLAFLSAVPENVSSLTVKWPNDILFQGRKLAGILVASRTEADRIQWAVVGFGVNVKKGREDPPGDLAGRIAYVHEFMPGETGDRLLFRIVDGLRDRMSLMAEDGWGRAVEEWSARARWDVPYLCRTGQGDITGLPLRLSGDGGLVLRTEAGEVTVYSGELEKAVQSPKSKV